jgi:2-C-methyl-D-erythritol 2,4-cyclodiphosphate synthase
MSAMRVGHGFDIHPLRRGRPLMLGGVRIAHPRGLAGHSDADCLLHAVTDALLGALGRGDIGEHFPPSDPRWKDAPSALFLRKAAALAARGGWAVASLDATVYAEEPRLGPHRPAMRRSLARLLKAPEGRVNIKAKTMEGFGAVGRRRALAAEAVVLLERLPVRGKKTKPA